MICCGNKLTLFAARYRLKCRPKVGGRIDSETAPIFYWVGGVEHPLQRFLKAPALMGNGK
jgi:hypothetical protein